MPRLSLSTHGHSGLVVGGEMVADEEIQSAFAGSVAPYSPAPSGVIMIETGEARWKEGDVTGNGTSAAPERKPLTGTVQRVGRLQKVSASDANGASADLRITLTGGTAGTRVPVELVVSLNTKIGSKGTAQMIDETVASPPLRARKSGHTYVFGPVQVTEPGPTASRVFRITNIRANAAGLSSGSNLGPSQVIASVSISAPAGISLVNSEQAVASVDPAPRARTR